MANYVEIFTSKLDWAMPFQRTGKFPIDRTDLFSTYDDALKYAKGDTADPDSRGLCGSSYIGQIIVVYENDTVSAYVVNASRTLTKLAATTASGDLSSDVATLQSQVGALNTKVGNEASGDTEATGIFATLDSLDTRLGTVETLAPVTVTESTPTGYAKAYTFTQNGATIGTVNIPKDMVVSSGTVETKTTSGAWGSAGTYLHLVLANATNDSVYINVGSLIEYVTSGSSASDMVVVSVNGTTHKVTATITDGTITLAKLASAVQTEINKAHSHSNKTVLDGITSDKVSAWDAKSDFDGDYESLTNKPTIPTVPTSDINANTAARHSHTNNTVLDGITSTKVDNWDAAQANVIESVKVGNSALTITDKSVNIGVAGSSLGVVKTSSAVNGINVDTNGLMTVNSVNVNKLVISDGDSLILDGGSST